MDSAVSLELRRHRSGAILPAALAARAGLSAQRLAAAIDALTRAGFAIESHPVQGLRLLSPPPQLGEEEIAWQLAVNRVGRRVRCLDEASSTSDVAWAEVALGPDDADGLAVFAEHQTAGRGRRGSHWLAPPHSSILCSVAVWMPDAPGQGALVTRAAAVAGAEAIEAQCRLNVGVRWPNDLVIDDRKVGGILVEARPAAGERGPVVIGIGINCTQGAEAFPPEIRRGVASLAMFSEDVDRTLLARSLLERLDEVLKMVAEPSGGVEVRRRVAARCRTLGQRITVIEGGKTYCGQVVDLDPDYGLVLRLEEGGIQRFAAMTCHVVGPNRQRSDR